VHFPANECCRYPKPGTPNPLVTVHTYALATQATVKPVVRTLTWPGAMPLTDRIILEVGWVGDRDLLVKEVDRAARTGSVVIFANGRNEGKVTRVLGKEGEEGDDGWIDHVRSSFPEGASEAEPFEPVEPECDSYSRRSSRLPRCRPDKRWIPAYCAVCSRDLGRTHLDLQG
jgi:hypothetical protein